MKRIILSVLIVVAMIGTSCKKEDTARVIDVTINNTVTKYKITQYGSTNVTSEGTYVKIENFKSQYAAEVGDEFTIYIYNREKENTVITFTSDSKLQYSGSVKKGEYLNAQFVVK